MLLSFSTIRKYLKDHQPHSNFKFLQHQSIFLLSYAFIASRKTYILFDCLSNVLLVSRTFQRGPYSVCPVIANSMRILCSKYIHWLLYFQPQIFWSKSNTFYKFHIFMDEGFENFDLYISNTLITFTVNSSLIFTKNKDIGILHTIVCDLTGY